MPQPCLPFPRRIPDPARSAPRSRSNPVRRRGLVKSGTRQEPPPPSGTDTPRASVPDLGADPKAEPQRCRTRERTLPVISPCLATGSQLSHLKSLGGRPQHTLTPPSTLCEAVPGGPRTTMRRRCRCFLQWPNRSTHYASGSAAWPPALLPGRRPETAPTQSPAQEHRSQRSAAGPRGSQGETPHRNLHRSPSVETGAVLRAHPGSISRKWGYYRQHSHPTKAALKSFPDSSVPAGQVRPQFPERPESAHSALPATCAPEGPSCSPLPESASW